MDIAMTATAANAAMKSILDKPLHELTEDDISQLTREDCRRYLKEKGMRRPSWNKSQAIQQVISLKSLLEPPTPRPSRRAPDEIPATTCTIVTSSSSSSIKELSVTNFDGPGSGATAALGEDGSPNQPGPSGSDPLAVREKEHLSAATVDSKPFPVRNANGPDLPIGQMTIFYSGKVNVYDGVPIDKAHAIMHLASSPIQFCPHEPSGGSSTHWGTPRQLLTSSVKFNVVQSMLSDVDSQTNRQVSLQRYYEKRKDRGKKLKRKLGSSSGLEMCLDHQMRMPVASAQSTESISGSPDQVGMSCPSYGFVEKQPKNPRLSVDLNDKV